MGVGIVERTCGDFGGTFAVNSPRACAVDRFAVDFEPGANLAENGLNFLRNRAVGAWANIEEEISVLADDVRELMNDEFGGFICVAVNVAPGFVADRSISLPLQRANVR